ncbi:MAG: hypothetical protein BroJett039_06860 [Chloroflexota bacterium]|nr:MAG: hypothetical protein BroJett039_06860 [Chloroflexota bacterium]
MAAASQLEEKQADLQAASKPPLGRWVREWEEHPHLEPASAVVSEQQEARKEWEARQARQTRQNSKRW